VWKKWFPSLETNLEIITGVNGLLCRLNALKNETALFLYLVCSCGINLVKTRRNISHDGVF
jgi:hypothetical protein